MAVSRAYRDYVLDQLSDLPALTSRAMFGGLGLYASGCFFGLISNDVLFLKVDDRTRSTYVDAGMKPFKPYPRRPTTFQYYEVPIGVVESADELMRWARAAVAAAARGPAPRPRSKASRDSSGRGARGAARARKAAGR